MPFDSSLAPPTVLRWLYVDFNSYFASVEQQLNPKLRGKPVIVVPVKSDSTCAIAASYEAKAYGIKTGTPVYEAKEKCPELICVHAGHEHYVDFHHRLIDEIERHIPVTSVCSIDEMACTLMKNEQAPDRATAIARNIKAGIARNVGEYVRCSIGIASNRYLAKIATDLQKPDGLVVLPPPEIPSRLLGLKLRDLPGIGANMEKRLNHVGIWDMVTLLSLEPKHMRAVWGNLWGEKMWYLLRGYDLPETENLRSSVGHSHVLAPELRPPEQAYHVARRLVMKATARLRRMEYYAGRFLLALRIENGPRLGLEARCQPAQDSLFFLELMGQMWRQIIAEANPRRIKKISVTLSDLTQTGQMQGDLFAQASTSSPQKRERSEKISRIMDRLNQKFGRDTVLLGLPPEHSKSFSGTKIAFTRIPDQEEFFE